MNMIAPAGYIVTDNELIHSVGATADAAWAAMLDAMQHANIRVLGDDESAEAEQGSWTRSSGLTIRSASAGLLAMVETHGGDCGWRMRNGVACTQAEDDGE